MPNIRDDSVTTKRQVILTIAWVCDVLGWFSPSVLKLQKEKNMWRKIKIKYAQGRTNKELIYLTNRDDNNHDIMLVTECTHEYDSTVQRLLW